MDGRIQWVLGDCLEIIKDELSLLRAETVIFASPPWGGMSPSSPSSYWDHLILQGPGYRSAPIFDLTCMQPYHLSDLMDCFYCLSDDIVLYLPRTSDVRQLIPYSRSQDRIVGMHYCLEGASKVGLSYID